MLLVCRWRLFPEKTVGVIGVSLDPNWLNALKLPTQVIIGLFLASGIVLLLDELGIIKLSDLSEFARPFVILMAVLWGSLSITGICAVLVDEWKKRKKQSLLSIRRKMRLQEREDSRAAAEKAALERLNHLSPQELRYLAKCLREGNQSFYAYAHSPAAATLIGKRLIYTPGTTHPRDYYPYTICDFAWKALLARKDEILTKDDENVKREEEEKARRRY